MRCTLPEVQHSTVVFPDLNSSKMDAILLVLRSSLVTTVVLMFLSVSIFFSVLHRSLDMQ